MDNELIQLVARLKIRLRQQTQKSLNARRFFDDSAYADELLENAEHSSDIELALIAMELRQHIDWKSKQPAPQSNNAPIPTAPYAHTHRGGFSAADMSQF